MSRISKSAAIRAAESLSAGLRLRLAEDGYSTSVEIATHFANTKESWLTKKMGFRFVKTKHFDEIARHFRLHDVELERDSYDAKAQEEIRAAISLLRLHGFTVNKRSPKH